MTILFALLFAPAVQAATVTPITRNDPSCVVMDSIRKQVCPVHHGRVTSYAVFTYEPSGFTTRVYSEMEWAAESVRLLKLASLEIERQRAAEAVERAKAAVAEAHKEATEPK